MIWRNFFMANFKSIVSSVLLSTTLLSTISVTVFAAEESDLEQSSEQENQTELQECKTETPKNVILKIADGMGVTQLCAYRYYKDNEDEPEVDKISFDIYLVVSQLTVSDDPQLNMTD